MDDSDANYVSPQSMANELAAYRPGTARVVYMTSDGGLSLDNSFTALIPLVPPSVQVVSADAAASLALAAAGCERRRAHVLGRASLVAQRWKLTVYAPAA